MLAFLKGIGGYIGGTVVGKVIVTAVIAGVVTGGAVAVVQNSPKLSANVESESMSISDVSTVPSSSTDSSSAVSQTSSAETSQVQSTVAVDSSTGAIILPSSGATEVYYAVINPDTGDFVFTDNPNYTKFKTELGGDAGTVTPNDSAVIRAVWAKIAAAKAAAAQSAAQAALSSSATSSN